MTLTMVELRHFRYFIAVAEEASFSRAARRLGMAQPPLSVAIRQLEERIGATLLIRTSREVKLTEAGETFLAGARRTLVETEAAVAAASRAAAGELGRLRVAHSWSSRFEIFPQLGRAYAERSPEVELLSEEMWNAQMAPALRSGLVDAAISIHPEKVDGLSYAPIRRERMLLLLSARHPLAKAGAIRLEQLAEDELLLFPREYAPRLYDFLVGMCRKAGFEPRQSGKYLYTQWTLQAWDKESVSPVPESLAKFAPRGVVAAPLLVAETFETQLMWRADDQRPALAGFIDAARSAYAVADREAAA